MDTRRDAINRRIELHSPSPPSVSSDRLREAGSRSPCAAYEREVPFSEAVVPEASDYIAYFCGLECYERWRKQAAAFLSAPR